MNSADEYRRYRNFITSSVVESDREQTPIFYPLFLVCVIVGSLIFLVYELVNA